MASLYGDFLKKESELIRGNPGRFLKHRPALPQHICFSLRVCLLLMTQYSAAVDS
jgi:hypothetical protein